MASYAIALKLPQRGLQNTDFPSTEVYSSVVTDWLALLCIKNTQPMEHKRIEFSLEETQVQDIRHFDVFTVVVTNVKIEISLIFSNICIVIYNMININGNFGVGMVCLMLSHKASKVIPKQTRSQIHQIRLCGQFTLTLTWINPNGELSCSGLKPIHKVPCNITCFKLY